jgi:hypothetical protein
MGWSMSSVSFRMSGSGSWQTLIPDETQKKLYADIYPMGLPLSTGSGGLLKPFSAWEQAEIVLFENEKIIPLGPIMTDEDLVILEPWFMNISHFMGRTVMERLEDYRVLASNLAEGTSSPDQAVDNILTILICALTLDSWVFSLLRRELIGTYPSRGLAGNFFFWGYAFARGPKRIFGFTTYNGMEAGQLHMIRSHGLDRRAIKESLRPRSSWDYLDFLVSYQNRTGSTVLKPFRKDGVMIKTVRSLQTVGLLTSDAPPRLAIPIFNPGSSGTISTLCLKTSIKIKHHFVSQLDDLNRLLKRCSFAQCSRSDALCMLFHLAYSYTADQLVENGVISEFPQGAGGEWGVWIS